MILRETRSEQPTEDRQDLMTAEDLVAKESLESEITTLEADLQEKLPRKQVGHKKRKLALMQSRLRRLESGDYGRRIPEEVSMAVIEQDTGRDFGRPNHECQGIRPPHHIKHFETFKGPHTRVNPHAEDNLEAPCKDCHNLAHTLDIPSGTSIEDLFKSFGTEEWGVIEDLWEKGDVSGLQNINNQTIEAA